MADYAARRAIFSFPPVSFSVTRYPYPFSPAVLYSYVARVSFLRGSRRFSSRRVATHQFDEGLRRSISRDRKIFLQRVHSSFSDLAVSPGKMRGTIRRDLSHALAAASFLRFEIETASDNEGRLGAGMVNAWIFGEFSARRICALLVWESGLRFVCVARSREQRSILLREVNYSKLHW